MSINTVKLAIVIPYYKLEFFRETLISLKDQTDQRFNLYIGDDCSPQDPSNMIRMVLGERQVEYHRFSENQGGTSLVGQWNRCIALTKGEEWIQLLCDDDLVSPDFVERFYLNLPDLEGKGLNLYRSSLVKIDEHGQITGTVKDHPPGVRSTKESFKSKYYGVHLSTLSENIFRKSVYTEHGFREFPLAWCADDMAWLEFTDFGDFLFDAVPKLFFRISDENISGTPMREKAISKRMFFELLTHNYRKHFDPATQVSNQLKFEAFSAMTGSYTWRTFRRSFCVYWTNNNYLEALKAVRRYLINCH